MRSGLTHARGYGYKCLLQSSVQLRINHTEYINQSNIQQWKKLWSRCVEVALWVKRVIKRPVRGGQMAWGQLRLVISERGARYKSPWRQTNATLDSPSILFIWIHNRVASGALGWRLSSGSVFSKENLEEEAVQLGVSIWSVLARALEDSAQICSKWCPTGTRLYCVLTVGNLGLMLTNTNQLHTCTMWDTASLWPAAPSHCRTFDSRLRVSRKTHIIWMAAASDMMVHSVL